MEVYAALYAQAAKWVPELEDAISAKDTAREQLAREALMELAEQLPREFAGVKSRPVARLAAAQAALAEKSQND